MSTGADLRFVERQPGVWYYEYQKFPYGMNEDYDVEGPFPSYEKAEDHCDANYPNAGGSWCKCWPDLKGLLLTQGDIVKCCGNEDCEDCNGQDWAYA